MILRRKFILAIAVTVAAIFGYVQCLLAQPLTPSGMEIRTLLGTEVVPCQVIGSPFFTTCTTRQIANLAGASTGITVGSSVVTGGATNQILYDNAGIVGEISKGNSCVYLTSGAGVPSCGTALPASLSAPSLTVTTAFTATGLVTNADLSNPATTVNGQTCTLGSTCTVPIAAGMSVSGCPPLTVLFNNSNVLGCDTGLTYAGSGGQIQLNQFGILTSPAAATWQFGALDTSGTTPPTAQTIKAQSASGNAAGANFTVRGSLSADMGVSGDIIFQTGIKSSTLNVQATPTNALVIKGETQQVQVAQGGGLTNAALSIGNSGYGFSEAPANLYIWVSGAAIGNWSTGGSGATWSITSAGVGSAFGQLANAVGTLYITQQDATSPIVFRTATAVTALTLDLNQTATFAGAVVAPLAVIGGLSRKGTVCVSTTNQLYYSATTC